VDASWQWGVVIAIELAAIAFLARKFFGRGPDARPRAKRSPDVPVGALVRKPRAR
jgi:hypothetical protein